MNKRLEEPVEVKVWGDYACFSNPAFKAERVSYAVMMPSAARGILEAIFWKPECRWHIQEIVVLNEIRYFSILRNEISHKQSERAARNWEQNGGSYLASDIVNRAQRHTLALRDVAYIIRAHVDVMPHANEHPAKFRDQFQRRVRNGKCFTRPYLGCREFAANFGPPSAEDKAIDVTDELGWMLVDMDYRDGRATPIFRKASIEKGVLRFTDSDEQEVQNVIATTC